MAKIVRALLAAVILAPGMCAAAQKPVMMLETGGHLAAVKSLVFTGDGKRIISAGDDKVIRIWDLESGKTVGAIRGYVGPGPEGQIYALALSPDGNWLAAAGWMTSACSQPCNDIRIFDLSSDQFELKALLRGHIDTISSLAFSPDGKNLVSGSSDNTAIIWSWDGVSGRSLHVLRGHKSHIYGVGYTPDGRRIVTGSFDKTLRLWKALDGELITEMVGHTDKVQAVAISPRDGTIASGDRVGEMRLWDGETGKLLKVLANVNTVVTALTFDGEGKRLVSATGEEPPFLARVWDVSTGKQVATFEKHDNTILDVVTNRSGLMASTGGNRRQIYLWDAGSGALAKQVGVATPMLSGDGSIPWTAGFSIDGTSIAWGYTSTGGQLSFGQGPYEWMLRLPIDDVPLASPQRVTSQAQSFGRPRPSFGAWSLETRKGEAYGHENAILDIRHKGVTVASIERKERDGYVHQAYTFTSDGRVIVSGGFFGVLSAYNTHGGKIGDFVGHEGEITSLGVSPDNRLLISAAADQTVRLWDLETRNLIVTLFLGEDGEWVIWTPEGYYASSPNGDKLIGWQINRAPDQVAEYVRASQLRNELYRPEAIERAIKIANAGVSVRAGNEPRTRGFNISLLSENLPPKLRITEPDPAQAETGVGHINIVTQLSEADGDPVIGFDVLVNNTKVSANPQRNGSIVAFEVPLGNGMNFITIRAQSKVGLYGEAEISVTQYGEGVLDRRDKLYVVAIGVDTYAGLPPKCGPSEKESCDLNFAGADARLFAETVYQQMGRLHRQPQTPRILYSGAGGKLEPTRDNIVDAMDFLRTATNKDTVVVFIAGHGYNDPQEGYKFLSADAHFGENGLASSSVIDWQTIEAKVSGPGRRLLFVDTCRAANAYSSRIIKDATDDGVVAFSATNKQQDAEEKDGNGVFTKALVMGFSGNAAIDRVIRVYDLGGYMYRQVLTLTNGRQTPLYYPNPNADNFVLVRMPAP